MTVRSHVDVEDLLRWTYGNQLAGVLTDRDQNQELAWLNAIGTNARVHPHVLATLTRG